MDCLYVLISNVLGGLVEKIDQWYFAISRSSGKNKMFEITSPCSPAASYEHTCGITPNRPLQSLNMFASLFRRSSPGQLVLRTTVPVEPNKIGSSFPRVIFQGRTY